MNVLISLFVMYGMIRYGCVWCKPSVLLEGMAVWNPLILINLGVLLLLNFWTCKVNIDCSMGIHITYTFTYFQFWLMFRVEIISLPSLTILVGCQFWSPNSIFYFCLLYPIWKWLFPVHAAYNANTWITLIPYLYGSQRALDVFSMAN